MIEVLNIYEWAKLQNGEAQFFFADETHTKAERYRDGVMFWVGDVVEFKNGFSILVSSPIWHFDENCISVHMENGYVVSINEVEWEEKWLQGFEKIKPPGA